MVDLVLLALPIGMDSVWAHSDTVWRPRTNHLSPWPIQPDNQLLCYSSFWISQEIYASCCAGARALCCVFRVHVCHLHQEVELPTSIGALKQQAKSGWKLFFGFEPNLLLSFPTDNIFFYPHIFVVYICHVNMLVGFLYSIHRQMWRGFI